MSVKSTQYLSRRQAVSKWVDLVWMRRVEAEKLLAAHAGTLSDTELEDDLEKLNDAFHGGEGFENYIIRGPSPPE